MKKVSILIFFICTCLGVVHGQRYSYIEKQKDSFDLCSEWEETQRLVGTHLKIYHNGGVYSSSNGMDSDFIDWINEDVKIKAGQSSWGDFEPQTGDVGEVIQVGKTKYNDVIYVLKIGAYYVPVKCSYLTSETNFSAEELYQERKKALYDYDESGCHFAKYGYQDIENRAGIHAIDQISENFACDLFEQGMNPLLLVKFIWSNGSIASEGACVLWKEGDSGFLKIFRNNEKHAPTQDETIAYYWDDVIRYYEDHVKGKENIQPESISIHSMNTVIQFYNGEDYYNFSMPQIYKEEDKKLPNVKFTTFLEHKLLGAIYKDYKF